MKATSLLPLLLLLAACGSDEHDVAVITPPPTPGPVAADPFTTSVLALVQTAPDDTEPVAIDGFAATMPEDTEPVPVP